MNINLKQALHISQQPPFSSLYSLKPLQTSDISSPSSHSAEDSLRNDVIGTCYAWTLATHLPPLTSALPFRLWPGMSHFYTRPKFSHQLRWMSPGFLPSPSYFIFLSTTPALKHAIISSTLEKFYCIFPPSTDIFPPPLCSIISFSVISFLLVSSEPSLTRSPPTAVLHF